MHDRNILFIIGQIYASAYYEIGLLMKALQITLAKLLYMQCMFPCEGGMHLLMEGFSSIGYLRGKMELRELSFESNASADLVV